MCNAHGIEYGNDHSKMSRQQTLLEFFSEKDNKNYLNLIKHDLILYNIMYYEIGKETDIIFFVTRQTGVNNPVVTLQEQLQILETLSKLMNRQKEQTSMLGKSRISWLLS